MASMARTENLDKLNVLEKFFDGPWNDWVRNHKWAIVILGVILSAYAAARSREIKGLSQMERYFPPGHPNTEALDVLIGGFNDGK